jgi:hypothetical protein
MSTTPEPAPIRGRGFRVVAVSLVLAVGAALVAVAAWREARERREHAHSIEASAAFAERCRAAQGEQRSVRGGRGAEGLVWMPRPLRLAGGRPSDRLRFDDAFDSGCTFDQCIVRLLRVSFGAATDPDEAAKHAEGFRYVEALDPRDLGRYRYQAGIGVVRWLTAAEIDRAFAATGEQPGPAVYGLVVQREEIEAFSASHGIAWDDISTDEDRAHGIAGSALTVLDLKTGEVIGRRIGYVMGARRDERVSNRGDADPSGTARSCPPATPAGSRRAGTADRDFALSLLR